MTMASGPGGLRVDFRHLVLLLFGHILLSPLVRFCARGRITGRPRLPGPATVVVANHRSFADPPLVGMFLDRPLCYFARANLWNHPFIGWVLRRLGGIPVDRSAPRLKTVSDAVAVLREAHDLLVFPEGTRTRDGRLGTLREGPALFARRAGAAILPVYLHRSERLWPHGSALPRIAPGVAIHFGPPVHLPERCSRRQDRIVTAWLQRWMTRTEARFHGG